MGRLKSAHSTPIYGNFKNEIPDLGNGCMLPVPTVIPGDDASLHFPKNSATLGVSLLCENMPVGNMPVVVSLKIDS